MNFNLAPRRSIVRQWGLSLVAALACLSAHSGQRFQANAAGDEITDNQTGLVWRRCTEGQNWNGKTCAGSHQAYTFEGALARAQNQAGSSGVAWRLPNVKELKSLVNPEVINPAINTSAFPGTPVTYFWSGTPVAGYAPGVWVVWFIDGLVGTGEAEAEYGGAARLVRTIP
ncbi:DUF1566 domain-containing protein [Ideonella sp.]|uniref:Lcl C-terminal domain-containing protein n=1 Tax=Ideonella sp. TaxID=1929293 RepID=UPI003BB79AC5